MMDTYWLQGIRETLAISPKDERRNTAESSNNRDAPKENIEHS